MARERSRSRARTERPDGRTVRLGIVASEYHAEIVEAMLESALREARLLRSPPPAVLRVPGVYDLPLAVDRLLRRKGVDAVVAVGAVVTGETDHDQLILHAVARSLLDLSIARSKPVALGVTGPGQTYAQAKARIDRAADAVRAAVTLVLRLRRA